MKMPRKRWDSRIKSPLYQWLGMNISLEGIRKPDGKKFLRMLVEGVGTAELTMDGTTAKWTIYGRGTVHNVAGVLLKADASISDGPARNATASATADTQDSEG